MKYVILVLTIFLTACKMDDSIKYKVYEVDNCEYILIRVGNDRWIAHKGNCKFCAERERTKMRIKSMEETGSFNFVIGDTTESESFWIGSRDKIKTNGKYATGF